MKDRLKYSGGGDGSSTIRRLSLVAIFMDRLKGTYMVEEEGTKQPTEIQHNVRGMSYTTTLCVMH